MTHHHTRTVCKHGVVMSQCRCPTFDRKITTDSTVPCDHKSLPAPDGADRLDAVTLMDHLITEHSCIVLNLPTMEELTDMHHHDHFGPCGIRNHPYEEWKVDPSRIATVLSEAF